MATKYEIFRLDDEYDGYIHVDTMEAGSARQALDALIKSGVESGVAAAGANGEFLVVPTTNATFLRRYAETVFTVEEHDPIHGESVQQTIEPEAAE